jgi:hypothetical protein
MMQLREWNARLHGLVVFRALLGDPVVAKLAALTDRLEAADDTIAPLCDAVAAFEAALFAHTTNLGDYLSNAVLETETFCVRQAAAGQLSPVMEAALNSELNFLQKLCGLTLDTLLEAADRQSRELAFLPRWEARQLDLTAAYNQRMREAGKKGYGMFAKHHVFTVENGRLVPVKYPDPQKLSELPGYEKEREKVIANTRALLAGSPANNVLLYGDAGTGKSSTVKWAADIINVAKRPLVYFGGGVRSAASCQPLRDLIHKAEIPATYTLMAAGVVPYGDPMNIGMVGMHGCYTSNRAVADCDVLIALGTRFSDRVALNPKTFARNATIIQIDIDPSELGKNVDVDLAIAGDVCYVLSGMLPLIEEKKHPDWMKMIHEWQAQDYHPVSDPTRLMPHQVIGEVCSQCGPEAVYVTDVGQHQMWAAQYIRHTKSRGFITSGGLGTMGFGYGAAIGAQMALGREQRVVMFTGDGSFHMNLNEACTAVSYELPIITVIFNNSVLGMVRQWQTTFYEKRYSQTDPHRRTDFVKLAEGFGLKGYRCTNLPEFQAAFADALKQKGPTWIECIIDKDEKVLPMIPGGGDINDIIME